MPDFLKRLALLITLIVLAVANPAIWKWEFK